MKTFSYDFTTKKITLYNYARQRLLTSPSGNGFTMASDLDAAEAILRNTLDSRRARKLYTVFVWLITEARYTGQRVFERTEDGILNWVAFEEEHQREASAA